MSSVQEIEEAIIKLPSDEFAKLREWLDEFEAQACDRKLEAAITEGKFDALADKARQNYLAGKSRAL